MSKVVRGPLWFQPPARYTVLRAARRWWVLWSSARGSRAICSYARRYEAVNEAAFLNNVSLDAGGFPWKRDRQFRTVLRTGPYPGRTGKQ